MYLKDIEAVEKAGSNAPIPVKEFKVTARLVTPKPEDKTTSPTTAPAEGATPPAEVMMEPAPATPPAEGAAPPVPVPDAPPATDGKATTLPIGGGQ